MSDEIKSTHTNRGFADGAFSDYNGVKCSIQKSSIATDDLIWLGCNEANPICMGPSGWEPVAFPPNTVFNTRMHLTRERVAALLPILQRFVETGEIE